MSVCSTANTSVYSQDYIYLLYYSTVLFNITGYISHEVYIRGNLTYIITIIYLSYPLRKKLMFSAVLSSSTHKIEG